MNTRSPKTGRERRGRTDGDADAYAAWQVQGVQALNASRWFSPVISRLVTVIKPETPPMSRTTSPVTPQAQLIVGRTSFALPPIGITPGSVHRGFEAAGEYLANARHQQALAHVVRRRQCEHRLAWDTAYSSRAGFQLNASSSRRLARSTSLLRA
jgi:hypothetical protein